MLQKSARLRAFEVRQVIAQGRSIRGTYLSAKILPQRSGTMRCAAVVGKALAKRAVIRNSYRRQIYRAVASQNPKNPIFIVFFLRSLPPAHTDALARDIGTILNKL